MTRTIVNWAFLAHGASRDLPEIALRCFPGATQAKNGGSHECSAYETLCGHDEGARR
jgi:hypothetical protein